MHGVQRQRQAGIGQAGQQPAVDDLLADGQTQQLHHRDLGQPVDHGGMPAALAKGFCKQQGRGGVEPGRLVQRRHQQVGQAAQQRVLVAHTKGDGGADQLGTLLRIGLDLVPEAARIKHRGRPGDGPALALPVAEAGVAAPHQVQMPGAVGGGKAGGAAQRAAVEDTGAQLKALQQAGQTVGHGTLSLVLETNGGHLSLRRPYSLHTVAAIASPPTPRSHPEDHPMLLPRQAVPDLRLPTLAHGDFVLSADAAPRFTLLVVYRGLHCPICLKYLRELGRLLPDFVQRGVQVLALSSDTRERAAAMAEKVAVPELRIGYDLPLAMARAFGLYISSSLGKTSTGLDEPALFAEPGVFLVRPDGTLYYAAVQTMPFARPHFDELLAALDFAIAKDYPARGEHLAVNP